MARLPQFVSLCICALFAISFAADRNKRHGHNGTLEAYDGKLLKFKLTSDQSKRLDKGDYVTYHEKGAGKSGKGVVIQDINAGPQICMNKIRDLPNYPKMVPHCKKVTIYETKKLLNGTTKTKAEFKVGVLGMGFNYFLALTHEPRYNTLTWTLDYSRNSDFDDNVGHWQVMKHPTKAGWSRVLYSTKVKLFPWIPGMIVNFLTTKALVESTTWVKKESEAEAEKERKKKAAALPDVEKLKNMLPKWMVKGGFSEYSEADGHELECEEDLLGRSRKEPRVHLGGFLKPFMRFRGSAL
jgi:ribosome-associated toxin RatA of RatAB toxin-antitoxin module